MKLQKVVATVLLGVSGVKADLGKELAYLDGLSDPFDPGFLQYTNPAPYTIKQWRNKQIPEGCKTRFTELNIDLADTEVYNVTYTNTTGVCTEPWIFCRTKDAQLEVRTMASLFGRMPEHMRELVRHLIAVPADSCSALSYTDIGDIVFSGNCDTPSIFIHETAHQLDAMLDPANSESGSQNWRDALAADSCVPDSYANTNEVEDFAQVTVVALYQVIRGTVPVSEDPGCFASQLQRLLRRYRRRFLKQNDWCHGRIPSSNFVSKRTGGTARVVRGERVTTVVGPCKFP
ncbi:hypothetical protein DRE_03375 [Drechslerella stenobrocha 248]|uniref:Lysine-specific metallo-endopeptidase domain-containing protein n=1 Tax=Drechslerella stenobrocha 248 TaxID=1043628 RepID=W7HT26_9PEZI|nr:hypothetical protein DRE_03375 [Drechslerella stenobrocha 248]